MIEIGLQSAHCIFYWYFSFSVAEFDSVLRHFLRVALFFSLVIFQVCDLLLRVVVYFVDKRLIRRVQLANFVNVKKVAFEVFAVEQAHNARQSAFVRDNKFNER